MNAVQLAKEINVHLLRRLHLRLTTADSISVERGWLARFLYFQRLMQLVNGVQGDIVECGVSEGYSLAMLAALNDVLGSKRRIWGFDSFEGLPAPTSEDLASADAAARKGDLSANERMVWNNLRAVAISVDGIALVKGWFADTLPRYDGQIALLHLDADLYESTRCGLANLWPKIAVGGVVAFDEYQKPNVWAGEKWAVDEFFASRSGQYRLTRDSLFDRFYAVKLA